MTNFLHCCAENSDLFTFYISTINICIQVSGKYTNALHMMSHISTNEGTNVE